MRRGVPAGGVLALALGVAACGGSAPAAARHDGAGATPAAASSASPAAAPTPAPSSSPVPSSSPAPASTGLASTGPVSTGPAPTGPGPTSQVTVSPLTAGGGLRPDLTVSQRATGSCEAGSDAVPAAVYRCFFGNTVIDPCWALSGTTVACLDQPWATSVVEITTSGLPHTTASPADPARPWGVALADGDRCIAMQGAHSTFEGRFVNYSCAGGLALLGSADTSGPQWTFASVTQQDGSSQPGPTEVVATAWYAGS